MRGHRPACAEPAETRSTRPCTGNWRERALRGGGELFSIDFGVSPGTPGMARRMVRFILSEWQIDADTVAVAELLASELATNAVRFGSPRPVRDHQVPYVTVAVRHAAGLVVLEVSDQNEKPPEPAPPDPDAEGGRGMMLVTAMSQEWSYYC